MATDRSLKEIELEKTIEHSLITQGGYQKGENKDFDRTKALKIQTLIDFVKTTQPKEWELYQTLQSNPEEGFVKRFDEMVAKNGLLHILRNGFKDRGREFRVCYFKPETELNKTDMANYQANVFECVRQVYFSQDDKRSVDIVLFLNGIPLISMELKNQFTGQNINNAIEQYRFNRASNEKIFAFNERVLVHFAVDLYEVYMTTKLQGAKTCFLPFNQGSNGGGNLGGKGNPVVGENDFASAYLWERILEKDSLLEIIQNFLHLKEDKSDKKKSIMIFPRYHQLDVVRKLLAFTKERGSGESVLIQHSAGSGKSNSIAWLCHRLASLHDENNEAIFNSVIVITDRKVLDSQLREIIKQFESVDGVVCGAKSARELRDALNKGARVIVTTLQKFPFVNEKGGIEIGENKYALVIDEAHSSQTGNTAKKMKEILGNQEEVLEQYAKIEQELDKEEEEEYESEIHKELASHGRHKNISYFAFTATPKAKTLELFGTKDKEGHFKPFHIYSMRQAVEEGFILNVLQNYITYQQYYQIALRYGNKDKELESTTASRAITKFKNLHPYSISQKTRIMLEHFMDITQEKIGGKAKAMLVSSSRLSAVKYFYEFKKQINEKKLPIDVLVAFSGEVIEKGEEYTEERLNIDKKGNPIKEGALVENFHSDDFQILIVAEKYQTGFDEPLLHTMFVDKALNSVKAVQTLSRLNRTIQGKNDTFVLDFVNKQEDIFRAFQPFYEGVELREETDPNLLYQCEEKIRKFNILRDEEIDLFTKKFHQKSDLNLATLSGIIKPAIDRYGKIKDEQKNEFKSAIREFNNLYGFITQVCRMFDKDLHKFSIFCKYLAKVLPRDSQEKVNLDDELLLEYYKIQKSSEGKITLKGDSITQISPQTTTECAVGEKVKEKLSEILARFNQRWGTNFTKMDRVIEQIVEDFELDKHIMGAIKRKDYSNAEGLYNRDFKKIVASRYEKNQDFFEKLFEDEQALNELQSIVFEVLKMREGEITKA
ncbi:type I restriction endonuclease subunit R [Helicobacter cholecystus]|uniref:type I restriction endonuclease subunit R n=1 Tax=Helicobacter cholecystus TaxID=45498 RepID=UPI002739A484|nr:type I restriction endonuclease [Helicobacter cholecystus]